MDISPLNRARGSPVARGRRRECPHDLCSQPAPGWRVGWDEDVCAASALGGRKREQQGERGLSVARVSQGGRTRARARQRRGEARGRVGRGVDEASWLERPVFVFVCAVPGGARLLGVHALRCPGVVAQRDGGSKDGVSQDDCASGFPLSEEPPASSVKHMPGKGVHWAAGPKAVRLNTDTATARR